MESRVPFYVRICCSCSRASSILFFLHHGSTQLSCHNIRPHRLRLHYLWKSKAPQAFGDAGIIKKLQQSGLRTAEQSALEQPATWSEATFSPGGVRREDLNVEVCQKIKNALGTSLASSAQGPPFQVILGRECSILPAIMSALWNHKPSRRVGMIYIDAETDLLQPTAS